MQGQFFPKLIPLNTSTQRTAHRRSGQVHDFWVIDTNLRRVHQLCNMGASVPTQSALWNKEAGLQESRNPFLSTDTIVPGLTTWSHVSLSQRWFQKQESCFSPCSCQVSCDLIYSLLCSSQISPTPTTLSAVEIKLRLHKPIKPCC